MSRSLTREVLLKKQLVVNVCEPYIEQKVVFFQGLSFTMECFGSFEYDDKEFIYGTEESEYLFAFDNDEVSSFPVIFALVSRSQNGEAVYTLYLTSNFSKDELEAIQQGIEYTLESQRVLSYYCTRCAN